MEGYSFFLVLFAGLCLVGVASGFYMIYSSIKVRKGVDLPKKSYVPFLPNLKQGNEGMLFIVGLAWSIAMLAMFWVTIGSWVDWVFRAGNQEIGILSPEFRWSTISGCFAFLTPHM